MPSVVVIGLLASLASILASVAGCAASPQAGSSTSSPVLPAVDGPATPRPLGDAEAELVDRVREVVIGQRHRLRACYEDALTRSPGLRGRVVLVLEVGQSGSASHVFEAHRQGLGEAEVRCFARVLRAARFHDGAASAVKIQVPLAFGPADGERDR